MQTVNAPKDPINAMTAENSGIAIETATAAVAVPVRLRSFSKKVRDFLMAFGLSKSIPRQRSSVMLSCW
jgi:hypothetical protein